GALGLADGADPRPMLLGGGHEGGVRAGTQNVEGIVGFGVAAGLAAQCTAPQTARLAALDRRLLDGIAPLAPTLVPLVPPDRRAPGLLALAVRGIPAEVLLHRLEARGVYCSAGSACRSRLARSPVLDAIGAPPEVGMIRISMGRPTSEADVDAFVEAVGAAIREGGA
ncbi:MAG: aminotransferase class V-fold PLP-dependent enzyme, partial [Myxococcota bacterium]|nr:aminotransferase class V-fold PLP-dependent enzyme [Myxococcota bacterium]